jgi:hypothetical protein
MRTLILFLSLLSAAVVFATTPAAACPEGYHACGDFCCGGDASPPPVPPVTP